jgi:hypothetical protein
VAHVRLDRGIRQALPTCEIGVGRAENGINLSLSLAAGHASRPISVSGQKAIKRRLQRCLDCAAATSQQRLVVCHDCTVPFCSLVAKIPTGLTDVLVHIRTVDTQVETSIQDEPRFKNEKVGL